MNRTLTINLNGLTDEQRVKALQLARALVGSPCTKTVFGKISENSYTLKGEDDGYDEPCFILLEGENRLRWCSSILIPTESLVLSWGLAVEYGLRVCCETDWGLEKLDLNCCAHETAFMNWLWDKHLLKNSIKLYLDFYATGAVAGVSVGGA